MSESVEVNGQVFTDPIAIEALRHAGVISEIGPPKLTDDQASALDAMALHTRGLEYSVQTMLNGGPYGGQTVKTAPEHDYLYIQDREAKWVYIKCAESSDSGQAQYTFARREELRP